jgi:[protein-PII] uridylyltransferase
MISAFEELKEARNHLFSSFSAGEVSGLFPETYTETIDHYFRRALQETRTGQDLFKTRIPFTLVAVGGYGRNELCLHSDIDILILFGRKIPSQAKKLAMEIFYPLWDLGLDLGYGVRSINDCLSLCRKDFEVLTSVMDARFIAGESSLYLTLMELLQRKVVSKSVVAFGNWIEHRNKIRLDEYGDASFLLEPHLKEGIGGLRDYHHIIWLAKVFSPLKSPRDLEYLGKLSHNEYQELRDHLNFIWLVRNHLHHLSGRKNDRLGFENQEEIARRLGFQNQKDLLAVEQFLGRLHSSMSFIKTINRFSLDTYLNKKRDIAKGYYCQDISIGLHIHQDELYFDSATAILKEPFLLMEIFKMSSASGCPLSMEAKRLIREFLYLMDDRLRKSDRVVADFLRIMKDGNTYKTLDQMFETGFLESFIPEFGKIKDRVQFDAYHIFPVGRHSLETIRHLNRLTNHKELLLLDIFSDLSDPEPLFLAALFHDIGKIGKGHAHRGIAITQSILKRFGYDKRRTEQVLFLVGHHLLLTETATRRDLNDEKVVVKCARTIGSVENLKMLYLLAWADSRATGPRAWNNWAANLVQELFFKILQILEKGELATPDASRKVKLNRSEVSRQMAGKMSKLDLEELFEVMSPRYLLNTSPHEIVRHLPMLALLNERLKKGEAAAFVLDARGDESESCWEVIFLGKDRPGLFSDIAGVMTLNNINILSAHIYTWRDGTAVDIFKVTSPLDTNNPEETWKKIKKDLRRALTGKLSLPYRIGQKKAPLVRSGFDRPTCRPPEVVIDNESSDFFTLIEIFAYNRLGLLFHITRTLFDLRLDIRIAKIATKGDQVADVFYVRDLEGQKAEDEEQVLEIRRSLLHELRQEGEA